MEGVAALPLGERTGDVGVGEQDAVVADLLQGLLADGAVEQHRVRDPARDGVPLGDAEDALLGLHAGCDID